MASVLDGFKSTFQTAAVTVGLAAALASAGWSDGFKVTNIVSDGSVQASRVDKNLVNAWGIASSPGGGPFWISANGTGVSVIYNGDGATLLSPVAVAGPKPTVKTSPTGQVFNGGPGFVVSKNGAKGAAAFIFATEDGTISGWNPTVDIAHAVLKVNRGASVGAVYKGLAIANNFFGDVLYATDFHNRKIDAFDSEFKYMGSFSDPFLPKNYAPFGIQAFDGLLYVTFAAQKSPGDEDDFPGAGHGFVDVFSSYGYPLARLVSHSKLNSPWGLAVAPDTFGQLAGSLLVGNFGDGKVNAFDPYTGQYLGTLKDTFGTPIVINGLWGLIPGNGGKGGDTDKIYFTSGPGGEAHGLFGSIAAASFSAF